MTAYINKLKDKTGNQQLPVTHERAVRDDNGTTAETKFQNLEGAMDKAYVAQSNNGMGRITLKKNIVSGVNTLTQSMLQATNTIYVIRYDFTLGEDITVPANCILEFDGGSINGNNYTLTLNMAKICASNAQIFDSINIYADKSLILRTSWYGLNNSDDCSSIFVKLLKSVRNKGTLIIDTPVRLESNIVINNDNFLNETVIVGDYNIKRWDSKITFTSTESTPSLNIRGYGIVLRNLSIERNNRNGDIINTASNNSNAGELDVIVENCTFTGGDSILTAYGRGVRVTNCIFSDCDYAIRLTGQCTHDYSIFNNIWYHDVNSGRSIIITDNRFHGIGNTAIRINQDPNNEYTSYTGVRIQNNTCDCFCAFVDCYSLIRNVIISGNVTYGVKTNIENHIKFSNKSVGVNIVNNTIGDVINGETGDPYGISTTIYFTEGKNIVVSNNTFVAGVETVRQILFGWNREFENIVIANNSIGEKVFSHSGDHSYDTLVYLGSPTNKIAIIGNVYNGEQIVSIVNTAAVSVSNCKIIGNVGFGSDITQASGGTSSNILTEADMINATV